MFTSYDEAEQWCRHHVIDPVTVTRITFLPQRDREREFVVAAFESLAVRYNWEAKVGQRGTAIVLLGAAPDGDGCFYDVNHRLLDYLPGDGRDLPFNQWLGYHGLLGCVRAKSAVVDVGARTMTVEGEFDLGDEDKRLYRNLFTDDSFTCATVSSATDMLQKTVDELRAHWRRASEAT